MTGLKIELQERDLEILVYLYNTKAATNTEIALVFFTSTKLSTTRLAQLVATDYILSATYSTRTQRYAGKYYRLTQRGLDEIVGRGLLTHNPSRINLSDATIATALKIGAFRTTLISSGVITLSDWQFPRAVRDMYTLPRFMPVCCRIHDIIILYVFGGAARFLTNTVEAAHKLITPMINGSPRINHVVIVYETRAESVRLLAQYVNDPVYMSTFADLPRLTTSLLTGKPAYHITELTARYRALHPAATFGPVLLGTIEAMPNGRAYEPTVLLVDGITGSIFTKQRFVASPRTHRLALIQSGPDLLLSTELTVPTSPRKTFRTTSKFA